MSYCLMYKNYFFWFLAQPVYGAAAGSSLVVASYLLPRNDHTPQLPCERSEGSALLRVSSAPSTGIPGQTNLLVDIPPQALERILSGLQQHIEFALALVTNPLDITDHVGLGVSSTHNGQFRLQ